MIEPTYVVSVREAAETCLAAMRHQAEATDGTKVGAGNLSSNRTAGVFTTETDLMSGRINDPQRRAFTLGSSRRS